MYSIPRRLATRTIDGLDRVSKINAGCLYSAPTRARLSRNNWRQVTAAPAGIAALPNARPLPVGAALQEFWTARLPDGERKILSVLIEAYQDEATGFRRSTRDAYVQRLAAKKLVMEPRRGAVQASAQLFG